MTAPTPIARLVVYGVIVVALLALAPASWWTWIIIGCLAISLNQQSNR